MNNNSTDSPQSPKKVTNFTVYPSGKTIGGLVTPPSNRETQPKETSNHQLPIERSKQGSKGISSDAKTTIGEGLDLMFEKYGNNLLWLIIPFDKIELGVRRKCARNIDKFINCVAYPLDELGIDYILNAGIQKRLSYQAKMPLFEINGVLPIEGRDTNELKKDIALKLLDIGNVYKIIKSVDAWYSKPIYNDFSNFDMFKNYFINQSAYDPIFKTITDEWGYKLPKTWHRIIIPC